MALNAILPIYLLCLSRLTLGCIFSPRTECPVQSLAPFIHSGPVTFLHVSCCQAKSEHTCESLSLLPLGAGFSSDTIESGSMGTVSRVQHPVTHEIFAVKAFHPADGELIPRFTTAIQREFSVGAAMANHTSFARTYALITDSESLQIHMIMEHVPLALLDLLNRGYWSHSDAHCLFTQVLQAVLDLHDSGYAHRDLKPDNVLVSADGRAKIIDLGEAVLLEGNATSLTGTPPYIAPEIYVNHEIGYDAAAADLWSLGMLLLRLYLEEDPWDHSFAAWDEDFMAFLENPLALLDNLHLDADIDQALYILLDMDPDKRYQIRQFWKGKFSADSLCAVDEAGLLHLPIELSK